MATDLNRRLTVTCIVGVLVSTYALYVEMAAEAQPGYEALCDLSEHVSCSRVLTSEYSKGFGIATQGSLFEVPNCVYGIAFYCLLIYMTTYESTWIVQLQLVFAFGSVATSVYLAYLLIFILYDFCLVCVSTYVVNALVTILVYKKLNALRAKKGN